MIRSQALKAVVFRFQTDEEWFKALFACGLTDAKGYRWNLIRANHKKRSMVMVRGRKL